MSKRKKTEKTELDLMYDKIIDEKHNLNHNMDDFYEDDFEEPPINEFKLETKNMNVTLLCALIKREDTYKIIEYINMVFKDLKEKGEFDEIFKIYQCAGKDYSSKIDCIIKHFEDLTFDLVTRNLNESRFLIINHNFNLDKFLTKYQNHLDLITYIRFINKNHYPDLYKKINNEKILKTYCDSVRGIENYFDAQVLADIFLRYPHLFNWHFRHLIPRTDNPTIINFGKFG